MFYKKAFLKILSKFATVITEFLFNKVAGLQSATDNFEKFFRIAFLQNNSRLLAVRTQALQA